MTKSPGQDAASECQHKSFNDQETQVGVVELEAGQLTVIDPDLLENGLMDAAVCKKSGFGLKLLESHDIVLGLSVSRQFRRACVY